MKPTTRELIETYRRLLSEGRTAEANALVDANRDNELFVSLAEFGEALVAAMVKKFAKPDGSDDDATVQLGQTP